MIRTAVLVATAVVLARAGASSVLPLGDGNFSSSVRSGAWLVEFYAPWCGHCKQLAPVFASAASTAGPDAARFAAVDCTESKGVASSEGIRGYPTLKLYIDGRAHDVAGPRTAQALARVAVRATSDPVADVEGDAALGAALEAAGGPVLAVGPGTDRVLAGSFENLAAAWRHEQSFLRLGSGGPGVRRLEAGVPPVRYEGEPDAPSLERWARSAHQRFAALSKVDASNFAAIVSSGKPFAAAIVDQHDPASDRFLTAYRGLAAPGSDTLPASVRSAFVFGHIDGVQYAEALKQYNVSPDALPRVVVIDGAAKTFYEDPRVREVSDVPSFLAEVAAGDFPAQRTGAWKYPTAVYNAVLFGENGALIGAGVAAALLAFIGLVAYATSLVCADDEPVHDDDAEAAALDQAALRAELADDAGSGEGSEWGSDDGEPQDGPAGKGDQGGDDGDAEAQVRRRAVPEE